MNKSNILVLGIILVLIGVFSSLQRFFSVNFWNIALLAGGFALLMLYQGKRKTWSLALGLYMLYGGFIAALRGALPGRVTDTLAGAMFFIVPGLIFLLRYFAKKRNRTLYPASFLIWFGFFTILSALPAFKAAGLPLFLICAGCSLLTVFFLGGHGENRGALYAGAAHLVLGIIQALTRLFLPGVFSALIAAAGVGFIVYSARKRAKSGKNGENGDDDI